MTKLNLPAARSYRILMTADTVGGVWEYALELTRALARYGCDVVLATMGALPSSAQHRDAAALANLTLCPSDFRLEWMEEPWRDVERAGAWLLDLERDCRPDVVHLNGYCHGTLSWRAPTLIVGHSCVLSWLDAVRGQTAGPKWNEYRRRVTLGLGAAAAVSAPSGAMLSALRQHYGRFAAASPIYNGCSASDFAPAVKEPLIVAAARLWDEAKNLQILAAVAPKLSWPVYAAGADRPPGGVSMMPIGGIAYLGKLPRAELAAWLARAAIFVHPARYEPFGLAVLEAALAGCVLVLGDIASLREIWRDSAVYVAPNDSAALVAALQSLITAPERRRRLARAARQRALQFSPARMAGEYMRLYRALVTARSSIPRHRSGVREQVALQRQTQTGLDAS